MNLVQILSWHLVLAWLAAESTFAADKMAQPFDWQAVTPESQGMSKGKLDTLTDELAKRNTRAFLVVRHDKIVHEWYAPGVTAATKQGTASLAKAAVGGMSLAIVLTDKKLSLDDPAAKFIVQWQTDPRKSKITLRQLGSHTSGLDDAEEKRLPHERLAGWKGDFWKQLAPPNDPFTLARDQTPLIAAPGTEIHYSNPGIALLTYCVTASLRGASIYDIRSLLRERLLKPIGAADEQWSVGYGKTFTVDGLPLVASWGGGSFTPRVLARIGRLLLREGDWDGQRVLSPEAVRQVTGDAGLPGHCGMGFWSNADGRYSKLPKDTYYGAGAGDKLLIVVPSLDLIVVRGGDALAPEPKDAADVFAAFHDARVKILFEPVIDAITDRPQPSRIAPYPASPVLTSIAWAPKETIVRRAQGSDNWPLTWAEDDQLYTAYGDGNGFEAFVPEKLSLGLARVEGSADQFAGFNLRAETIESKGPGKAGRKASGILCVDQTLYLWSRNTGNAQLASSHDHGRTWHWCDWKFTNSFGCPTFLNFGRNYAGARDEFVYVYSPDADNAYQAADRFVLARAPKDKLCERAAYEFFARLDDEGRPRWSGELAQRGAVFANPGACYRSGLTYNAGLKRYLWVQILPDTHGSKPDTRFEGGFGIYDAPEPWGPWTTVFFTEKWDVGPGDTASFPTKWMSADGRTLHLVFSGDDSFSVRRAELTTAPARPTGSAAAHPP